MDLSTSEIAVVCFFFGSMFTLIMLVFSELLNFLFAAIERIQMKNEIKRIQLDNIKKNISINEVDNNGKN